MTRSRFRGIRHAGRCQINSRRRQRQYATVPASLWVARGNAGGMRVDIMVRRSAGPQNPVTRGVRAATPRLSAAGIILAAALDKLARDVPGVLEGQSGPRRSGTGAQWLNSAASSFRNLPQALIGEAVIMASEISLHAAVVPGPSPALAEQGRSPGLSRSMLLRRRSQAAQRERWD